MPSTSPEIILIAAMAANRVIGRAGSIPWHLPAELRYFKRTTMGHPIIMGRKTWESIGRPLPGRRNIVISRRPGFGAPGAEVVSSLEDALALCGDAGKLFVIGGAEIFAQAMGRAHTIFLTVLDREVAGDVVFPDIPSDFRLAESRIADEGGGYRVEVWRRTPRPSE